MNITSTDLLEWSHHFVTQQFLTTLKESRQEVLESWGKEQFIAQDGLVTLQTNAKALGGVHALTQLIDLIESYTENDK